MFLVHGSSYASTIIGSPRQHPREHKPSIVLFTLECATQVTFEW
jgi:hypothetical protein